MKKALLALAFTGFAFAASATANFTVIDAISQDIVGTNQNYYTANGVLDTREYDVHNISGSAVSIKVRKTTLTLNDASSQIYFCTDQNCYNPTQTLSYQVNMNAGDDFLLTLDYNSSVSGMSQVRYTIYNVANPNDSASFIVTYNGSPAGINANTLVKASVSNPMPNPAASTFSMSYKLGSNSTTNANLVVYNMLGARVMVTEVTEAEGTVKMDVSTLEQGVYFCSLESDGKTLATRRLVVSH